MNRIAFVGEETSIEFFKTFGADIMPAEEVSQAQHILENLQFDQYAAVFITEEVFDQALFDRYVKTRKLTVIPSLKSAEGKGYSIMEHFIGRATGLKGK